MKIINAASVLFCLTVGGVTAFDGSIPAQSDLGQKLLAKARRLENNGNYNY
jgi:hypothetical protein